MKLFGSLKELVAAVFRKNSQEITFRPNQSTTYTAARDFQLPPGDSDQVLVSATSSQSFTGKTIDGDDNTVQDLPITSLKTVLADANKVLRRDASGVPQSGNTIPNSSALVTADASQTLTAKTIDGDDNTIQDLALTSLKTVAGDANKVIRRDGSGVVVSGNALPNSSEIVTTDASQTLTTKTFSGGTLTGSITASGATLSSPTISSPIVRGDLLLQNTSGAQPTLQLSEDPDNGTNKVSIQAPATLGGDYTLTLPVDDGAAGEVLSTDGSGNLSWASAATNSLAQYNVNVGNSSGVASQTNTNLLGDIKAETFQFTVTADSGTDLFTSTNHGLLTGDTVYFTTTGSMPTGTSASTTYWVIKINNNDFHVATSLANARDLVNVNFTTNGSGTITAFAGGLRVKASPGIPGDISGSSKAGYYIGEVVSASNDASTSASTSYADVGGSTISLSPGIWLLQYNITYRLIIGSSAGLAFGNVKITTSGDVDVAGTSREATAGGNGSGENDRSGATLTCTKVISISSATSYKLKCRLVQDTGTGHSFTLHNDTNRESTFQAIRIA